MPYIMRIGTGSVIAMILFIPLFILLMVFIPALILIVLLIGAVAVVANRAILKARGKEKHEKPRYKPKVIEPEFRIK